MIKTPYDPLLYRVRRYVAGRSDQPAPAAEVTLMEESESTLDPAETPAPAPSPAPEPDPVLPPGPDPEPILSDIEIPSKPPENTASDGSIAANNRGALEWFLRR